MQAAYLLSPPAQEKAHEASEAALPKHKTSDSARAPVPPGEDNESTPRKSETDQADEVCLRAPLRLLGTAR